MTTSQHDLNERASVRVSFDVSVLRGDDDDAQLIDFLHDRIADALASLDGDWAKVEQASLTYTVAA